MKNRKAWGLVAVLTGVLLGSGGLVGLYYHSRLPRGEDWLLLDPREDWGVRARRLTFGDDRSTSAVVWLDLGIFAVRVR